jgi:putative redox protein
MTTTSFVTIPTISDSDRAERLIAAGTSWGERITDNVSNAALTYKVTGEGYGSVASRLTAGKHIFHIDEPTALAGDDKAASPVEIALGAFIACQVVVYRLYAQNLGIVIDSIEATAEGDLDVRGIFGIDKSIRPGFSAIRLSIRVTGPETDERYQELQLAVDANCPVLDLFANPTPVKISLITN